MLYPGCASSLQVRCSVPWGDSMPWMQRLPRISCTRSRGPIKSSWVGCAATAHRAQHRRSLFCSYSAHSGGHDRLVN